MNEYGLGLKLYLDYLDHGARLKDRLKNIKNY
jgi:hypothetical protein